MKRKGLHFDVWLKDQLKNPKFKKAFEAEDVRARLSLRIVELRKARKLSQTQLAKRLRTTQQMISDIETFKHSNITLSTLQKIAQALHSRLVIDLRQLPGA